MLIKACGFLRIPGRRGGIGLPLGDAPEIGEVPKAVSEARRNPCKARPRSLERRALKKILKKPKKPLSLPLIELDKEADAGKSGLSRCSF